MSLHNKSADSKSKSSCGCLYIVATPIGNLGDITLRAVETLKQVALIACEDTRVTRKLLTHFDIHTETVSYREQNDARMRPELLALLQRGDDVALVSDAGTPLISDPGLQLVQAAWAAGITVVPIPGPSAVMAALSASGLAVEPFTFVGFLPAKASARRQRIGEIATFPSTLVLLESPQRLKSALADLAAGLGAREAVVARELTKRYETVRRGVLSELHAYYAAQTQVKGEIVVVIGPPAAAPAQPGEAELDTLLQAALAQMSVKQAAAEVSAATGASRSRLYQRALELKGKATIRQPRSWGGADGEQ